MKVLKSLATCLLATAFLASGGISNSNVFAADPESEASVGFLSSDSYGIISAPDFVFGTKTINLAQTLEFTDTRGAPPSNTQRVLQVADDRETPDGWEITATLSNFVDNLGAPTITLNPGIRLTLTTTGTGDGASYAGSGAAPTAPTVTSPMGLDANGAANTVASAASGTVGLGLWKITWLNAQSKLEVPPQSQVVGNYLATITWMMTVSP